jgi:hypothetical protein
MVCDGSCFVNPRASDQFPCQDGETLCLVYCKHEHCYILKTFTPIDEAEQIYQSVKGLFMEFKRWKRRKHLNGV